MPADPEKSIVTERTLRIGPERNVRRRHLRPAIAKKNKGDWSV
jgi:hypothetical protein